MEEAGVRVVDCSSWYRTRPVPSSAQPWYVNAVARVEVTSSPAGLLRFLLGHERRFGRRRGTPGEARVLDLDLLAFDDLVSAPGEEPVLPHPRLHDRAFVLVPLGELVPGWRHPVSGCAVETLIATLPDDQVIEPMTPAAGRFGTEWEAPRRR